MRESKGYSVLSGDLHAPAGEELTGCSILPENFRFVCSVGLEATSLAPP